MEKLGEMKRRIEEVSIVPLHDNAPDAADALLGTVIPDRRDGRQAMQLREMEIEQGLLKHADGSARVLMGRTVVTAAVFGPMECLVRLQQIEGTFVSVSFRLPSTSSLATHDPHHLRDEPGCQPLHGNHATQCLSRTQEVELGHLLGSLIRKELYPRTAVHVGIHLHHDDGSVLSCAINAAVLALLDAGLEMHAVGAAASVAWVDGTLLVDPDLTESNRASGLLTLCTAPKTTQTISTSTTEHSADLIFCDVRGGQFFNQESENLITGRGSPFSVARNACNIIWGIMRASVRRKEALLEAWYDVAKGKEGSGIGGVVD
uniref:Exoribonuclease phosphorolytic domain-containing protein n=1 Tax=Compsopogon caeruleus TaxID=31354 RepID=A0A6T6B654_9RHOD|mmetsp:Transcript_14058/g.28764  ORF Transcript_14058/g.28764 Transcript_14058/m.28764 type:complete len:318 (+) Transcript_14058:312-1265(+)